MKLEPGKTYIVKEELFAKRAIQMFKGLMGSGYAGMALVSAAQYEGKEFASMMAGAEVWWVSRGEGEDMIPPADTDAIKSKISGFASQNHKSVVLLACLEAVRGANPAGFRRLLQCLGGIRNQVIGADITLLLAICPSCFKDDDQEFLKSVADKIV